MANTPSQTLTPITPGGLGVLWISSDGDDRRIFGFEIFDSGIFLGTEIWQVFFWGSLISVGIL